METPSSLFPQDLNPFDAPAFGVLCRETRQQLSKTMSVFLDPSMLPAINGEEPILKRLVWIKRKYVLEPDSDDDYVNAYVDQADGERAPPPNMIFTGLTGLWRDVDKEPAMIQRDAPPVRHTH